MQVLLATRSVHKLEEIRAILSDSDLPVELVGLDDLELPPLSEEEELEPWDTFEENALSKARYFCGRSGLPTLSDDSGLAVDALDGAPGVRSKRFSPPAIARDVEGQLRDDANNLHLLELLKDVAEPLRTARYVCVVAFVDATGGGWTVRGEVEGRITTAPAGQGGFGYDPLFFVPELGGTFGESSAETKHALSHRGRAFRAALPRLRDSVGADE